MITVHLGFKRMTVKPVCFDSHRKKKSETKVSRYRCLKLDYLKVVSLNSKGCALMEICKIFFYIIVDFTINFSKPIRKLLTYFEQK